MGDTVIKAFKDLTIWIGSLTVLPGEKGLVTTLKIGLKRLERGKLYRGDKEGPASEGVSTNTALDRLTEHVEEEELEEAAEAGEHGDSLERDIHFYHFVLVREIRRLMKDVDASPPRQYTYQEWSYFLRLIGQDEDDPSAHRKPKVEHATNGKRKNHDLGVADGGEDANDDPYKWSWLGIRSPLMGNKTEAQWLLHRLSATLELEMRKMREPDAKKRKDPPPISMADLKKKPDKSDSDPEQLLEKDLGAAEMRRRQKNGV